MNKLVEIGLSLINLTKASENEKFIELKTEFIDKIKTLTTELK